MREIKYRTQENDPTGRMLPSGRHIVDKHGTIHAPKLTISKRERAKIKRQAKKTGRAKTVGISIPATARIGGFFA